MLSGHAIFPSNTATACSALAPEVAAEEGWGAPGGAAWDMPGRTSLHPKSCLDLHTCKTNLGSLKNLSVGWSCLWVM